MDQKKSLLSLAQGRDSVAQSVQRLATGLEAMEIESRWGAKFSTTVQTRPREQPLPRTMDNGPSFQGVNRIGRGFGHTTPSSAEVKERVQLGLHSASSGPLLLSFFLDREAVIFPKIALAYLFCNV